MATSASPASPHRALCSGVSVLEHLGDGAERNIHNDNSAGAAAVSESLPSDATNLNHLGGSVTTPAYALLVGVALDNQSKILSIPLTSMPTTLGKEHDTKDVNFVGLTECNSSDGDKAEGGSSATTKSGPKLSKSMCCIYYRDGEQGGKLGCYKKKKKAAAVEANNNDEVEMSISGDVDALNGMTYVPYEKPQEDNDKAAEVAPNDIIRLPSMQQTDPLPPSGFFAVECTGRKIIVGGKVLKKGQHAMLSDGITVQIASHCFYFLLPKNADAANNPKSIKVTMTTKTVKVVDSGSQKKKKRDDDNNDSNDDATSDDDSSTVIKSPRPTKKSKSSSTSADNNDSFASTLESKADTELLQMLSEATQSNGWDKHSQNIGTTLATRACRAAANSSKLQKLNKDFAGVTQRDVMNWINKDSDTFVEYETMMLRKIEPKSFGIAMGKAIIRAGYTKSDVKSGRANRWFLPSDVIVAAVATVAPPTMKKSPSASQMKLPTSGGSNHKLPQKPMPMVLPTASSVKEDMEKEQTNKPVTTATNITDDNSGSGSGGAVDITAKEESNENAILPSHEDLKTFVEAWLARPENAQVSSTLLPTAKEKEEIMQGCGVDKKRLESFFYRLRKKLKQKAEGAAAAATGASDGSKTADGGSASVVGATVPAVPQTAATAAPTPTTTTGTDTATTMTQQELENIAASRAFNDAIQSGSPFKVATEEAAAAAAAARANQNLAAAALKSIDTEETVAAEAHANQNLPAAPTASHLEVGTISTDNVSPEKQE
eukprot:scaffold696_cov137-Skeletonema_menzelii.AAC.2